ncbi:hypothetical protein PISL3812_00193 [Talaromyces islandicus]|uniref:Uncharacterized protein n=1 Tax=Talaromyces islandicus TaxID=28573 RepID=A0A0U1LIK7_TALIS|nr:hypothetical protein PISL3812_00193 [Talaromyces islandicus]
MPLGEAIDDPTANDDYVAQLLASEAKDRSLKYSTLGLQAYLPRRPTERAPKPNTRFLKNILRDTDSHNAALKRKEEQEARERMRQLHGRNLIRIVTETTNGTDDVVIGMKVTTILIVNSLRGLTDDIVMTIRGPGEHETTPIPRIGLHDTEEMIKMIAVAGTGVLTDHVRDRPGHPRGTGKKIGALTGNLKDPLEDLVGPLPTSSRRKDIVASRGRGSYRENTSTIDSHFAHDYDPKLDVHLSEDDDSTRRPTRRPVAGLMTEEDDWDMALEALRDRAEWKKKGEERLRVAGFDSDVVDRWKSHPAFSMGNTSSHDTERNIEDVQWAKKGEGREWDRGKVMNEDGVYDIKAQWS